MESNQDMLRELKRDGKALLERFSQILILMNSSLEEGLEIDIHQCDQLLGIIRSLKDLAELGSLPRMATPVHSVLESVPSIQTQTQQYVRFNSNIGSISGQAVESITGVPNTPDSLVDLFAALELDHTRFTSLEEAMRRCESTARISHEMTKSVHLFSQNLNKMKKIVMKARMVPLGSELLKFTHVVKEMSSRYGKQVELIIDGGETEIDKNLLEDLSESLMQLVHNSLVYSIESIEERHKMGKPSQGIIHLSVNQQGNTVVICLEDDGRGLDISCGVGMQMVRKTIQNLKGVVDIQSKPDDRTKMTIKIPKTLAITPGIIVEVMGECLAVPSVNVIESMTISRDQIQKMGASQFVRLRDELVPLLLLADVLGINQIDSCSWYRAPQSSLPVSDRRSDWLVFVVFGIGSERVGFVVDRIVGQQDVVIKPLGKLLGRRRGFSGGCVLGDGRVALVVDAADVLAAEAIQRGNYARRAPQTA